MTVKQGCRTPHYKNTNETVGVSVLVVPPSSSSRPCPVTLHLPRGATPHDRAQVCPAPAFWSMTCLLPDLGVGLSSRVLTSCTCLIKEFFDHYLVPDVLNSRSRFFLYKCIPIYRAVVSFPSTTNLMINICCPCTRRFRYRWFHDSSWTKTVTWPKALFQTRSSIRERRGIRILCTRMGINQSGTDNTWLMHVSWLGPRNLCEKIFSQFVWNEVGYCITFTLFILF